MADETWPEGTEILRDHIRQRPLVHALPPKCPHCQSAEVHQTGHTQTLLGGTAGSDPNHHWRFYFCKTCDNSFIYQHRYDFGWYTAPRSNQVLAGVSNCYEDVEYSCTKCGGPFRREHRNLENTASAGEILCIIAGKKTYRTFWRCAQCEHEIEVP